MPRDLNQLDDFFMNGKKEPDKRRSFGIFSKILNFFPSRRQFFYLPNVLSKKERFSIMGLAFVAFFSIVSLPVLVHYHNTDKVSEFGGSWTEVMVGIPQKINPLLLQTNSVDNDLSSLIYSGLLKYDGNGKLQPNLAESYSISDNGLEYTFTLKQNLKWHDGATLNVDDVIFTVLTAQNNDYSSTQKTSWTGVEVEKIDDLTVKFKLKNKYAQFIDNATIGIIPKHIWENVKPSNFSLADYNLKPVGSGPYKISKVKKDTLGTVRGISLAAFDKYALGEPYVTKIDFMFYESEQKAIDAFISGEVEAIGSLSTQGLEKIKSKSGFAFYEMRMPRFFAVFFNQSKSKALSEKNVRLALNYATDKQAIIDKILSGKGEVVDSPLLPGIVDLPDTNVKYGYDLEKAQSLIKEIKDPVEIELTTSSILELPSIAEELKSQWEKIGITVNIKKLTAPEIQQAIKERDYSAFLFGAVVGFDPDPFSFWHSSQRKDPAGLNLSLFSDSNADKILEDARMILDDDLRKQKYGKLQDIINTDASILTIYSPHYVYVLPDRIKNVNIQKIFSPSSRFGSVNEWYISTKRVKGSQ